MPDTRLFVSGLPPSLTNEQLRKHFSHAFAITDAQVIPNRRFGFVGLQDDEQAQKAVKFFNKTFIRMSKISVDLARDVRTTSHYMSI